MKKFLFLIYLLGIPFVSNALSIQNITVSDFDENNLNIKVVSYNIQVFNYLDYNYTVDNQTMTLNICYLYSPFTAIDTETNQFQIPVNTQMPMIYTLVVNIFFRNQTTLICDYAQLEDTAGFTFSTPLTEEISLSNKQSEFQNNLILSPNPSNGIINFNLSILNANIEIIDNLGRIVKVMCSKSINHLELFDLQNAIYFLKINSDQGDFVKKVILKN